jgi:HEAT repeat protein
MDELSQIDDDRAAELLVSQMKVFGRGDHHAARCLESMGKRAEKFVLPLYNDENIFIRGHARAVLKTLGTSDEEIFKQTIKDLGAVDTKRREQALEELRKHRPKDKEMQERVARALEAMLTVKDFTLPDKALDALETWATNESGAALCGVLGEGRKAKKAVKILAKLKDDSLIKPLVQNLNTPERLAIARILVGYGEKAEPEVQPLLDSTIAVVRQTAVLILAEVGTNSSVKMLNRYINLVARLDKREAALGKAARDKILAREKQKLAREKEKDKDQGKDKSN